MSPVKACVICLDTPPYLSPENKLAFSQAARNNIYDKINKTNVSITVANFGNCLGAK